jgi:hypothetical protein
MASVRVCWLLALLLVTASSGDDVSASNKPSPTAWALAAGQPKDGPDVTPDNATVHAMASVRPEFVHVRNGELPLHMLDTCSSRSALSVSVMQGGAGVWGGRRVRQANFSKAASPPRWWAGTRTSYWRPPQTWARSRAGAR